eukprot:scaffold37605_cov62-Phaeocystis_antarctica.AAC.7
MIVGARQLRARRAHAGIRRGRCRRVGRFGRPPKLRLRHLRLLRRLGLLRHLRLRQLDPEALALPRLRRGGEGVRPQLVALYVDVIGAPVPA